MKGILKKNIVFLIAEDNQLVSTVSTNEELFVVNHYEVFNLKNTTEEDQKKAFSWKGCWDTEIEIYTSKEEAESHISCKMKMWQEVDDWYGAGRYT